MSALTAHCEPLAPEVRKLALSDEHARLTHAQVIDALHTGKDFAGVFSRMIVATGFEAVFWEMPPLTVSRMEEPFECVITASAALARMASDFDAFREHFAAGDEVATFTNLGGDARLVAPAPAAGGDFRHLAAFCRTAAPALQREFFAQLARAVVAGLSERPLWVSTSGLGIGWLHARLDSRPKYYVHAPYRRPV